MNHELKSKPFSELFATMPPEAQAEARRGAEEQLRVTNAQDAEAKVKVRHPHAQCVRAFFGFVVWRTSTNADNGSPDDWADIELGPLGKGDTVEEAWLNAASRIPDEPYHIADCGETVPISLDEQIRADVSNGFICGSWTIRMQSDGEYVYRCDRPDGHVGDHSDSVLLTNWSEGRPAPRLAHPAAPESDWKGLRDYIVRIGFLAAMNAKHEDIRLLCAEALYSVDQEATRNERG